MGYRVIKRIKGRSYIYEQSSHRVGDKVKTRSKYIGPLSPGSDITGLKEVKTLVDEARKAGSQQEFIDNVKNPKVVDTKELPESVRNAVENYQEVKSTGTFEAIKYARNELMGIIWHHNHKSALETFGTHFTVNDQDQVERSALILDSDRVKPSEIPAQRKEIKQELAEIKRRRDPNQESYLLTDPSREIYLLKGRQSMLKQVELESVIDLKDFYDKVNTTSSKPDDSQKPDDQSAYSPERLKLHDDIINNKLKDMVVIDPDIVKECLPEYDPKRPELVHKESSDITRKFLFSRIKELGPGDRIAVSVGVAGAGKTTVLGKMSKNYKIIYETTARNLDKTLRCVRTAKRKGLIVDANMVGIPLENSLAAQEYRKSKGQRAIPDDIVRKNYPGTYKSFNELRDHADNWRMYDHSIIGKPQAVAEKLDGQFQIFNGLLYNKMVRAYETKKPKKGIPKRAGNQA